MQKLSVDELEKVNKYMQMQYEEHKKIMLRTRFFILLYTAFVFIILSQYVYHNMFIELDFFFVEIGYDIRGAFWFLTLFYLTFFVVKMDIKKLRGDKMDLKMLLNFLRNYYLLFNFFLVWPALFVAVSDFPFLGNFGKVLLGISPILVYVLRILAVDFVGSDKIVRGFFRSKDVDVRSCPGCHEYILRKPIFYCPNCGNLKHGERGLCRSCGFDCKILDFDFPKFCPHCGLGFKYQRIKSNK